MHLWLGCCLLLLHLLLLILALNARIYPFNHLISYVGSAGDAGSESRFQNVLQAGEAFEFVLVVQVVPLVVQVSTASRVSHVALNRVAQELGLEPGHDARPVLQVNIILVVQFVWRRGGRRRARTAELDRHADDSLPGNHSVSGSLGD